MSPINVFAIYSIAGSVILFIVMRIFGARDVYWQPFAGSVLAAACVLFLPKTVSDVVGFVVLVAFLRFTTRLEWGDIVYPVLITRLSLVAVFLMFIANKAVPVQ